MRIEGPTVSIDSHEHFWTPPDEAELVFEDGMARFKQVCTYAEVVSSTTSEKYDETFYGYGAECDAVRKYDMEAAYIWYPNGQGAPVPKPGEEIPPRLEEGLMVVEKAARSGDADSMMVDPDPDCGSVRVEYDGWKLIYKP